VTVPIPRDFRVESLGWLILFLLSTGFTDFRTKQAEATKLKDTVPRDSDKNAADKRNAKASKSLFEIGNH
jgi:hypothetical protein